MSRHPDWTLVRAPSYDWLGFIPEFLSEADPHSAREQLHTAYAHGGGWNSFKGFTLRTEGRTVEHWTLAYPGDPEMRLLAYCCLHDEMVLLFEHSWVCVVQTDGSYDVARMD